MENYEQVIELFLLKIYVIVEPICSVGTQDLF